MVRLGFCDDPRDHVSREGRVGVPSDGIPRGMGHENDLLRSHRGGPRWGLSARRVHWARQVPDHESRGTRREGFVPASHHVGASGSHEGHGHECISLDHQIRDE